MSELEALVRASMVVTFVVVLVVWPGRVAGVLVAMWAWTVIGPEACWSVLGLTAAGVLAWKAGDGRERVASPVARVLLGWPWWVLPAVLAGSVGFVALTAPHPVAQVGLLIAAVSGVALVRGVLLARSLSGPTHRPGAVRVSPVRCRVDEGRRLVSGPCPVCTGRLVATVRRPGSARPSGVVGRAGCESCGARFVAVGDDQGPGGVVWLEMPHTDVDQQEGIA